VFDLEIFVIKLGAVDRLAAGPIAELEVASLEHELRDDSVEDTVLIAEAFLAGGELAEVLGRLWHDIVVELEGYPPGGLRVDGDVKKDISGGGHFLIVQTFRGEEQRENEGEVATKVRQENLYKIR